MLRHGNIFVVAPYYCAYDNLINHLSREAAREQILAGLSA